MSICSHCDGSGEVRYQLGKYECPVCRGQGHIRKVILIILREFFPFPENLGSDEEVLNYFTNYQDDQLKIAENVASEIIEELA